jgi:hypothetical protein
LNQCKLLLERDHRAPVLSTLLPSDAAKRNINLVHGRASCSIPVGVVHSSRYELLATVDVERRARECRVAHDVNG